MFNSLSGSRLYALALGGRSIKHTIFLRTLNAIALAYKARYTFRVSCCIPAYALLANETSKESCAA